ncbi:hypothetical protein CI266_002167 [Salmonella enterica subsp. enterica serovar Kotte]|nr:hypothetical protein [Salmonella enterica subsp. enterica serovar Kotte]
MTTRGKLSSELVNMFAAPPAQWGRAPVLLEIELMARELRECRRILKGLPQAAIDGGWTARGISGHVKQLEAQLERYRFMERARQTGKTGGR